MPTFSSDQIHDIASRILQAAGVSPDAADIVAAELTDANLVGHDSHGIIRLTQYVEFIEADQVRLDAEVTPIVQLPSVAVLDGGFGFGQTVIARALEMATQQTQKTGAYTVLCRNTNHVGRLGSYTRRAALDGYAALMGVNGAGAVAVAPWGGIDKRYGTNPISMAAPRGDEPIVLDMTTSVTAEGKLRVALQKGNPVPEGWVIDQRGNPTTQPKDFYDGGAILPLGGPFGFKGYGLGVMMDVFCGILSGAGIARDDVAPGSNGVWLHLIDVESVIGWEDYNSWVDRYVQWLCSSRTAPGVDKILLPGEIEAQCRARRSHEGIPIPDETWQRTLKLAEKLGASLDV